MAKTFRSPITPSGITTPSCHPSSGVAVKWLLIPSNPCERASLPKKEKTRPRYLDEEHAARLGHADPTTTTRIYTHAIQSADAAAAEQLDMIFTSRHAATG